MLSFFRSRSDFTQLKKLMNIRSILEVKNKPQWGGVYIDIDRKVLSFNGCEDGDMSVCTWVCAHAANKQIGLLMHMHGLSCGVFGRQYYVYELWILI